MSVLKLFIIMKLISSYFSLLLSWLQPTSLLCSALLCSAVLCSHVLFSLLFLLLGYVLLPYPRFLLLPSSLLPILPNWPTWFSIQSSDHLSWSAWVMSCSTANNLNSPPYGAAFLSCGTKPPGFIVERYTICSVLMTIDDSTRSYCCFFENIGRYCICFTSRIRSELESINVISSAV